MPAEARNRRAQDLQARILGQGPRLAGSARDEFDGIRRLLLDASDDGAIQNPPQDVYKLLKRTDERGRVLIAGGAADFRHEGAEPHFLRRDSARLNFIVMLEEGMPAQLLRYKFELALVQPDTFLRFELDAPGGAHEVDGLRSHLHPGSDAIRVPAPIMSPLELLDLLLYRAGLEE